MASTLTRRNAEISFKALSLGASDYIPKPESTREAHAGGYLFPSRSDPEDPDFWRQASPPCAPPSATPAHGAVAISRHRQAARSLRAPGRGARGDRGSDGAARLRPAGAARAAGRILDQRGPQALMSLVTELGPVIDRLSGPDHAAHAADLYDHPRRTSRPLEPTSRP